MPAKNSIKEYRENAYYHIYNRGVEKRSIFIDEQDYAVFISYLKNYLLVKDGDFLQDTISDPMSTPKQKSDALRLLKLNNFHNIVSLIAYCQMTNHFHFLLKQKPTWGMDSFMNSLMTRYTMYFNKKYKRVGHLFQGKYKAVLVRTEEQLLHLTRYIHCNSGSKGLAFQSYPHSSYLQYISDKHVDWVNPEEILGYFTKTGYNSYASFVGDNNGYDSMMFIKGLTLSEDMQ
ncbi:MAG: transposase [Patescibacteria group bacterium]